MKYLIVEGVDGSGKTTICEALQKEFEVEGYKSIVIHEPGFCDKRYRELIMDPLTPDVSRLFLFLADRKRTKEFVESELTDYDVVIFDRSFLSTLVYQGKIFGTDKVWNLLKEWDLIPKYDLLFVMDISKQEFISRSKNENELDKFCEDHFNDLKMRYLELGVELDKTYIIDANNSIHNILREILGICCYKKLFPGANFCSWLWNDKRTNKD